METTATQAVEHVSFKDRISKMNEQQLRDLATDEFSVNIDGQLKKEAITKFLLEAYENSRTAAESLNRDSAQLFLDRDEDEPIIQTKFMPLDFPNAPVEFAYDGGDGVTGKGSPKLKPGQKKRLRQMPRFTLIPGETYKLPLSVIKHLEGLTYRDSKPVHDPVSGMITGNIPVIKPRFMLQTILTDAQLSEMSTTL